MRPPPLAHRHAYLVHAPPCPDAFQSLLASFRVSGRRAADDTAGATQLPAGETPHTHTAFVLERMEESMALFAMEHRLSPFDVVQFNMKTRRYNATWTGSGVEQELAGLLRRLQPHDTKLYVD